MIKQFIPQEVCLKCQGCCRFAEENSCWAPCLLEAEIENLIDKEGVPAAYLTLDKRIKLIANTAVGAKNFLCPFLNTQTNICQIYANRPFECQLYPFLLSLRGKKVLLTIDLNCPYIKEKLNTQGSKDYLEYLIAFLNAPARLRLLKDNPQILQAYEEVLDVAELVSPDENK